MKSAPRILLETARFRDRSTSLRPIFTVVIYPLPKRSLKSVVAFAGPTRSYVLLAALAAHLSASKASSMTPERKRKMFCGSSSQQPRLQNVVHKFSFSASRPGSAMLYGVIRFTLNLNSFTPPISPKSTHSPGRVFVPGAQQKIIQ